MAKYVAKTNIVEAQQFTEDMFAQPYLAPRGVVWRKVGSIVGGGQIPLPFIPTFDGPGGYTRVPVGYWVVWPTDGHVQLMSHELFTRLFQALAEGVTNGG